MYGQAGTMDYSSAGPSSSSSSNMTYSAPAPALAPAVGQSEYQAIFDEFETYPFSEDANFNAIRGAKRTAAQIDEMIGRAQWFFFTRMKGATIPWEAYASYANAPRQAAGAGASAISGPAQHRAPSASSSPLTDPQAQAHSRGSTPQGTGMARDLSALDGLAEAKRMMAFDVAPGSTTPGREGENGLSFATLCGLISEGRAGDLPGVQQIPDQLNELPPSQSVLPSRPKPWEQHPHHSQHIVQQRQQQQQYQPQHHQTHQAHHQRTSPPGTSALFHNPSLAPTPSASDLHSPAGGFAQTPQDVPANAPTTQSYAYQYTQYPLSPLMGISAQHSPVPVPVTSAFDQGDPGGSGHGSGSPSRSFANLSFAHPGTGTSITTAADDPYGSAQGPFGPDAGAGAGGGPGANDHTQPGQSGYYQF